MIYSKYKIDKEKFMKRRLFSKLACLIMATAFVFGLTACGPTPNPDGNGGEKPTNLKPVIYLAGDSTVKTYVETQYIAGWGQYLGDFLDGITVANAAQGGRSSRSFINEGRLYDIDDPDYSYNFSENGGKSIASEIKEGDFLFIQFGHNDDDTKDGSTKAERMVPLGKADENGIYPTTAPTGKQPTEGTGFESYGSEYYAYECGGTYKWFLKQYIDLARAKGAIPVLVTPVARVKFSGNEIVGGPGLHGPNFAYVQAVRQLANEEDCLLIDLFAETKTLLETATSSFANYLMAIVPNTLNNGPWPTGYDTAYNNPDAGFTKIEATHYNKYGAFLTAAKVAENILAAKEKDESHKNGKEYFTFADHVKSAPSKFVVPSNLLTKDKIAALEGLFTTVNPTDPERVFPDPLTVVAKIAEVCSGEVDGENYLEYQTKCKQALLSYNSLNVDDKSAVTNYSLLLEYIAEVEKQIEAHRPKPEKVVFFDPSSLTAEKLASAKTVTVDEVYGVGSSQSGNTGATVDFKIVGASGKEVEVKAGSANFIYGGSSYSTTKYLSMGGSATFASNRYVEFTTTGDCRITVVAQSTGTDNRVISLVNADSLSSAVASFDADASQSVTSQDVIGAGTYRLGSTNKGVYIYAIIIEYYA